MADELRNLLDSMRKHDWQSTVPFMLGISKTEYYDFIEDLNSANPVRDWSLNRTLYPDVWGWLQVAFNQLYGRDILEKNRRWINY